MSTAVIAIQARNLHCVAYQCAAVAFMRAIHPACAEGNRLCVTSSRWGAKLAPQLAPEESAEIYTGVCVARCIPVARLCRTGC